ncbi:hypothetical protein Tco_1338867 [Tanacetum coccineum]
MKAICISVHHEGTFTYDPLSYVDGDVEVVENVDLGKTNYERLKEICKECCLFPVHGPFELGTTRNTLGTTPEGGVLLRPERPRTYEDLSDTEKKGYDADVRATNIVLQGLPKDIYKLINHNIEAKAIWDNVKMLLAGSELTKEDKESQLYKEFERFKMLPGENINEYYVRFHKLVNDMRNIRMTMPNIQLNSKFVNNMSPEYDRFVTAVKLNKGLKETNHEQLYAYLKQHEKHAAQDRLIIERITPATNDQLAFVSTVQPHAQSSHVQSHQYHSSSINPQSLQYPQFTETSQIDSGYTQTDEILDNLTKQMALLAQSFRATLPQTNNQLRTSSNTRNQATIQDGRVVVQNVQGRQNQNQNQRYFARGNGAAGNGGAQNRAGNANAGQDAQLQQMVQDQPQQKDLLQTNAQLQHLDVLKRIDDPKMMVNDFPMVPLDQWGWILMDRLEQNLQFLIGRREPWRISALSEQLQQECDSFVQQRHSAKEFSERSSRGQAILAFNLSWFSLEAIRAVESSLGSCGIANLAICLGRSGSGGGGKGLSMEELGLQVVNSTEYDLFPPEERERAHKINAPESKLNFADLDGVLWHSSVACPPVGPLWQALRMSKPSCPETQRLIT